jgi:predicted ATPase
MHISIKNFKAFQNEYEFDFKKINLFVGANNSGKSTFSKFIHLLKNNFNISEIDKYNFFGNYIHRFENNNSNSSYIEDFKSFLNDNSKNQLLEFKISLHSEITLYFQFESDNEYGTMPGLRNFIVGKPFSIIAYYKDQFLMELFNENASTKIDTYLLNDFIQDLKKNGINKFDIEMKYVIDQSNNIDWKLIDQIYDFPNSQDYLNIPYGKEMHLLLILLRALLYKETVYYFNNFKLILDYNLKNTVDDPFIDLEKELSKTINKYFGLNYKLSEIKDEEGNVYLTNEYLKESNDAFKTLNHYGQGITLLLPYIYFIEHSEIRSNLGGHYYQDHNYDAAYLLLNEPERGLHPDWQINFIKYLIDRSHGLHYIIETHSLTIVRAVQLAVAEGKISKNDVRIYDFYTTAEGEKQMDLIHLDENGQLDHPFYSGFANINNEMEMKLWEISQQKLSKN